MKNSTTSAISSKSIREICDKLDEIKRARESFANAQAIRELPPDEFWRERDLASIIKTWGTQNFSEVEKLLREGLILELELNVAAVELTEIQARIDALLSKEKDITRKLQSIPKDQEENQQ